MISEGILSVRHTEEYCSILHVLKEQFSHKLVMNHLVIYLEILNFYEDDPEVRISRPQPRVGPGRLAVTPAGRLAGRLV